MDRTEAVKSRELANPAANVGAKLALLADHGLLFPDLVKEELPTTRRESIRRADEWTRINQMDRVLSYLWVVLAKS